MNRADRVDRVDRDRMSLSEGVDLLRQGLVTGITGLMAGVEGDVETNQATFITFNQDTT